MKIIYERKFLKDIQKIKDKKLLNRIREKIEQVEKVIVQHTDNGTIPEINGFSKLQGYESFYRIRVGDYRLGICLEIHSGADEMNGEEDIFRMVRCLHRKHIYQFFP